MQKIYFSPKGMINLAGILYLVGTPIGNLGDMSPRAVETLTNVDFIAAEDTRVSGKLLAYFGISKPMISYFEHNAKSRGEMLLEKLLGGENVALMTDAGMPAISDPGEDMVKLCAANGIKVVVVPGPSAVVSALAMSALSTGRFCFEGFLSVDKNSRREHLNSLIHEKRTMIFYEAPHKLYKTLRDMLDTFGDRKITLCREITKMHEENIYTTLSEAKKMYFNNEPKGEFVLVIEGKKDLPPENEEELFLNAVNEARLLTENGMSKKDAAKEISAKTGFAKNKLYSALIN